MGNWYMLTMVGKDRPGIVAEVSQVLFEAGGNLGEASMARLGGNFTVMLMLQIDAEKDDVENLWWITRNLSGNVRRCTNLDCGCAV